MNDSLSASQPPQAVTPVPANAQVQTAIAQASERTGIDFGYLLAQAKVESSLDIDAKAPTSSASGLFQFIESTWLNVMQRHGGALGYGQWASQIESGARGAFVRDPVMRGQILALRNDPQAASYMAAALAQDNSAALAPVLGRAPDAGELYLAHFLGSGGANRFLSALQDRPNASAAAEFAKPAAANRAIFYTPGGQARSFAQVMAVLRGKIEQAMPDGDPSAPWPVSAARAQGQPYPFGFSGDVPFTTSKPIPHAAVTTSRLSDVLQTSFDINGAGGGSSAAGDHARRAYERLKAFGL